MNDELEKSWLSEINQIYNSDKEFKDVDKEDIQEINKLQTNKAVSLRGVNYSYTQIVNLKKILKSYTIPDVYVAYIDGDEEGQKMDLTKHDVLFYVINDSTDIVELMLNEYYTSYIYVIPKVYLALDSKKRYKILNYKKLVLISKNERNYKRIALTKKNAFMKPVHKFVFEKIILEK